MNQIFSAAPPGAAKMKHNILANKTNLGARPRKRSVIMKKMKKLLAILMTMAMVMGLGITGFAAPVDVNTSQDSQLQSNITVTGLSNNAETVLNVYQYAFLQYDEETNEYSWRIEEWAQRNVFPNQEKTTFEIINPAALKVAAEAQQPDYTATETGTTHVFENMPIGGYIIIPSDANADYEPLFAVNTYDRENSPNTDGKPEAIDVEAVAKSEHHTITKEQTDDFAQIGSTVNYTIRATFPAYTNSDGDTLEQFAITDTPTGLDINENDVTVMLGTEELTETDDEITIDKNTETGVLTVTFNSSVLTEANAGKDITITYTAIVTDTNYNNSVAGSSSTTDYNGSTTTGSNSSIEITKVDAENQELLLKGVEFEVYDLSDKSEWTEENPGTPMRLVYDEEKEAYRPEIGTEEGAVTTIATKETEDGNDDSKLKIVGLDEGYYYFKETKAPNGYAINKDGLTVQIVKDTSEDLTVKFLNTKMAALPETGGMGTTLFTIAGCVIMISAAGLFFATRKKAN